MTDETAFPNESVLDALNAAVESAGHLSTDQKPVVALGRVLAKRVDKLDDSGFVIDGRFDNVSSGMFLKVLDALGLTVKPARAGRAVPREDPLVPPSAEKPEPETPVTDMERFRAGRAG